MARNLDGFAVASAVLFALLTIHLIATNHVLALETMTGAHLNLKLREFACKDFATARQLKSAIDEQKTQSLSFLKLANRYLADFANSTTNEWRSNATIHAEQCVRNPLFRFKVIRRMAHFFRVLSKQPAGLEAVLDQLKNTEFKHIGPDINSDLNDAVDAILHIHFIFNLNVTDLAAGNILGMHTGVNLPAFNCLFIGYRAKVGRKYALAVEWLQEALRLANVDGTAAVPVVRAELLSVIQAHNWQWENDGLFDTFLYTRPLSSNLDKLEGNLKVRDNFHAIYAGKGRNCSYWPMNIWGLCSGENLHVPAASTHMFCWLEFKANKVLTIGPLKMEFLSRDPDIVQIYDAISASASAENISRMGKEGLKSLEGILAGINDNARLVPDDSQLQVECLLPGAQSQVQVDSLPQEGSTNHRDATLMLNLNNVEAGGYTVFPAAFATCVPTKGSAIFWFNNLSDGSKDFSTACVHCPVVLGQKFVARKWFRFSDHSSKCLLQPKGRYQVQVNGKALPVPAPFHDELITEQEYRHPVRFIALEGVPGVEFYEEKKVLKYSYNSVHSLKLLMCLEWDIYQTVRRMAKTNTVVNNTEVNAYLEDFNEKAYDLIANETAELKQPAVFKLAWNPLAVYRTLWRFENSVKNWASLKLDVPPELQDYVTKVYAPHDGPTHTDLEYAVAGILVTQIVYDFETKDIANGIVAGIDTGIKLSARHCLEFGRKAIMSQLWYLGVEWMETAMDKIVSQGPRRMKLEVAEMEFQTAVKAHDMHFRSTRGEDLFTFTQPISRLNITRGLRTNKAVHYEKYQLRTEPDYVRTNYFGVCQGKSHQTAHEQSKLFCWLETQVDPYWKIGPLKAELLSMHPNKAEVVQFHDILSNQLLQYLRNVMVSESQDVVQSATRGEVNPVDRLGASLWLDFDISQESVKTTKIVEKATGLRLIPNKFDTGLQIGTYSPGSHYDAHLDTVHYESDNASRIATFMFYLNDVVNGGATSFAQAGVRVAPKAGSAIFWYNLHSDGVLDDKTHHGACPVIFGEKLVATQWLHYGDQDQLRCHVEREKQIEILVNGKSKYAT